jgi:hypothetical protein
MNINDMIKNAKEVAKRNKPGGIKYVKNGCEHCSTYVDNELEMASLIAAMEKELKEFKFNLDESEMLVEALTNTDEYNVARIKELEEELKKREWMPISKKPDEGQLCVFKTNNDLSYIGLWFQSGVSLSHDLELMNGERIETWLPLYPTEDVHSTNIGIKKGWMSSLGCV